MENKEKEEQEKKDPKKDVTDSKSLSKPDLMKRFRDDEFDLKK